MNPPFLRSACMAVLVSCGAAGAVRASATLPRLEVGPGGHYLQTAAGRPFFWLGDTAWGLINETTADECHYYLATRARQGFTVIQTVVLFDPQGVSAPNALGQLAFVDHDPARPVDAFFDHVVDVVHEAQARGLYVALVPVWGDKLTAPWGTGPRIFRSDNLGVARDFGRYLGGKLKRCSNLIWVIGGDRPARLGGLHNDFLQNLAREAGFSPDADWTPIWHALEQGIADGTGTDPLCIYHPQGGEYSSSQQLPDAAWIDINGLQSGHGGGHDLPVWDWVLRDYRMTPAKPTVDIEPNYEDHPYNPWPAWDPATGYFRDHDARKQCYRSVLAGAAGVTYGNHAVWQFASLRNGVINQAERDWIEALQRPGGRQMIFLRELIESRPFFRRMPDPAMIVQQPGRDGAVHVVASRDEDGTYAFVYFPSEDLTADIDLGKLRSDKVAAWWYDPRTGYSRPIGDFPGHAVQSFKSPPNGPDWVLLLEDPACHYSRPGVNLPDAAPGQGS